jgi:hypothetical protein
MHPLHDVVAGIIQSGDIALEHLGFEVQIHRGVEKPLAQHAKTLTVCRPPANRKRR